jgi:membrane-bound ClpP family serine protease
VGLVQNPSISPPITSFDSAIIIIIIIIKEAAAFFQIFDGATTKRSKKKKKNKNRKRRLGDVIDKTRLLYCLLALYRGQ